MRTHSRSTAALLVAVSLLPSTVAFAKGPAIAAPAAPAAAPATNPSAAAAPAAEAPHTQEGEVAKTPGELCSAAYERTQTEKQAGHYVAASAAALECSQLQCNAAIVQECVRFYGALEAETPTLVFSARKAEGGELSDVRVEMDGKLVAEQLTGRPVSADPGPHNFVFIHKKRGLVRLSETARVGDKARVVEVTFADPDAKSGAVGSEHRRTARRRAGHDLRAGWARRRRPGWLRILPRERRERLQQEKRRVQPQTATRTTSIRFARSTRTRTCRWAWASRASRAPLPFTSWVAVEALRCKPASRRTRVARWRG